jgi:tryptophan synthase alpha chain
MTSRIETTFARLKSAGRRGFIPFVTAGDPSIEISQQIVDRLVTAGADIIELGVPFSDPMADGPTIQRSSQRALQSETKLADVLSMARRFTHQSEVPIVLFSYLNPLLAYGIGDLIADSADAGISGILITDAVDDEAEQFRTRFYEAGINLISLVAPTTSDERLSRICGRSSGFIYAVSRAGVTGAQSEVSRSAEELVLRCRKYTDLPIAVGFGISTREQVSEVWRYADAAIVGSAIVSQIERNLSSPSIVETVGDYVAGLVPPFAKTLVET